MVKTNLRCAGASDPGRVRRNNEDRFYIDAERGIFLVVDGIGGQAAGEKAAEIAVERIRARLERQTGATEQRIREAIAVANNEILRAAESNPEWDGMACVLTLVVLENGSALVGHVGDSRLYQVRRGGIRKITHDHSPVGEREDSGDLSEAEAMRHPRRNEVFRDVGSEEHAPEDPDFVELLRVPFDSDSALLLCSDGLSDQAPAAAIARIVERHAGDPQAAVRELIEAANAAGGKDNVTVVLVEGERFAAEPAPPPVEPPRAGILGSRAAFLIYGALIAGLASWFLSRHFQPVPPEPQAPAALTVSPGEGLPGIADAIARAKPGDTVEVSPGEYRERVTLKSGVNLRGSGAILRAPAVGEGPVIGAKGVKDVRVAGFRILADRDAPIPVAISLTGSAVEIDDVEIDGAGVGIEIRGDADPVLRANTIRGCSGAGILISGGTLRPWVSHNFLGSNKIGLAALDGAAPVLVGNVFEKNGIELPDAAAEDVQARNYFFGMTQAQRIVTPRKQGGEAAPAHTGARKAQ